MAAEWDLRLEEGMDYEETFVRWGDVARLPFTGLTPKAQIRNRPDGELLLDLTPYLSVVSQTLDGVAGDALRLAIPGEVTEGLTSGVWDLVLLGETSRRKWLHGTVTVTRTVTDV